MRILTFDFTKFVLYIENFVVLCIEVQIRLFHSIRRRQKKANQLEICIEISNHCFFLGNMWSQNIAKNIEDLCKNKKTGRTVSQKKLKNVGDSYKNKDLGFVAGFFRKLMKK